MLLQAAQSRDLTQMLRLDQLIEKLRAFYRTGMFITVYTIVRYWLQP
jgi:hypothetical protein